MGIYHGRMTPDGYEPSLLFRLTKPRNVKGRTINGLGETEVRRPDAIYHRFDYLHPWLLCGFQFLYRRIVDGAMRRMFPYVKKSKALKKAVHVAPNKVFDTPDNWAQKVKEKALSLNGCEIVGIAKIRPEWVFKQDHIPQSHVIILGERMNYEMLMESTKGQFAQSSITIGNAYMSTLLDAIELANWIRTQGYDAHGMGGPIGSALNINIAAIHAGLGQLGKHGSVINDEIGSNVRFSYVLTNLQMTEDAPREIGVDEFCTQCRLCTTKCPVDAISDSKQMVRGVEKWYVDFDKCVPFFNDNQGCGICLAVCPWSKPDIAPSLSQKMLKKIARA